MEIFKRNDARKNLSNHLTYYIMNDKIVNIKVTSDNKIYRGSAGNLTLDTNDKVVFEVDQFQDIGVVVDCVNPNDDESKSEDEVTIIRKLTEKDNQRLLKLKEEATATLEKCREKIKKHNLEMDLLDADISYDGKKLTFYFCASGRVDFRSLVPDLASTFKKLIRLQQVGMRDKVKCMDSVGRCGRGTCCRKFLKGDLENISAEMAQIQNLGQMGSSRVTGVCGKLMCCLRYELEEYRTAQKKMPALGSTISTKEGEGLVISVNVIKNRLRVELNKDKRVVEVDC